MLSQFRKIFVIVAAEKHVHKIWIEELRTTIMLLEFIKCLWMRLYNYAVRVHKVSMNEIIDQQVVGLPSSWKGWRSLPVLLLNNLASTR